MIKTDGRYVVDAVAYAYDADRNAYSASDMSPGTQKVYPQ